MAFKLSGFRELEKKLAVDLPKATARNVLRRVSKGALEPMADVAAQKAPERTGRLAYSITVSEDRTRRVRRFSLRRINGVQMAMGPATGVGATYYASFDEFGTVDTPAFGYMRYAWDTGQMSALEYVQDNLWREIDKAVGRIAKKRAR